MRRVAALGILIAWHATAALAAPTEFEVQASNVTAHPVGQKLQSGAKLVLPHGGAVTLIVRAGESVKTRECNGKYEGPVEKCGTANANCPWWKKMFNKCPPKPEPVVPHGTRGGD